MDCYKCCFHGTVIGSCHSSCNNPILGDELVRIMYILKPNLLDGIVEMDSYGIKMCWCNFPLDFDPTWIKSCKLFKEKEGYVVEDNI